MDYVYEYDVKERFVIKHNLTEREMEIIELAFRGDGNAEISEKLFISIHTVKKHMTNIFSKLDIKRRSQLSSILKDNGID